MNVIESEYNGFCKGVTDALSLVDKAVKTGTPVFLTGEIIHNTPVTEYYQKLGVRIIDQKEVSGTVVVAAHGETDANLKKLSISGVNILNGTCPVVEARKRLIDKQYKSGELVVLFVKSRSHAEVKTLINDNNLNVVSDLTELNDFINRTASPSRILYVHTQTTFKKEKTEDYVNRLRPFYKDVVVSSSVCKDCYNRQCSAERIARLSDCVIVVGSSHSSNAGELIKVINNVGSKGVLVESEHDIPDYVFDFQNVGIISSASSSYERFKAIVRCLKNTRSLP